MICLNCGNQMPDDAVFCPSCGAGAGEKKDAAPQIPPQQPQMPPPVYANVPPYAGADIPGQKKKKGISTFLLVYLALLLLFIGGVVAAILFVRYKNGPLHGAKIKKQIVWETGDLTVTAKKLDYDKNNSESPYYITLEAENSGASLKTVTVEDAALNGIMVESELDLTVPAGGKASGELHFSGQELKMLAALSEFYTISFILRDENTLSDTIRLQTSLKEQQIYINTGDDAPQYEGDGVLVNYTSLYPSFSSYGPALEFYVENNTDKYIRVKSGDITVNGGTAENKNFDEGILPHACRYVRFVLDLDQMEKDDLLPLKKVESEFDFYDPVTGEQLLSVPISVNDP